MGVEKADVRCFLADTSQQGSATEVGGLISAGKDGAAFCRLAAVDALPGRRTAAWSEHSLLVQRDAPHRGTRLFFDLLFTFAAAAPAGEGEPTFDCFLEIVVGLGVVCVRTAEVQSLCVERILNFAKQSLDGHR